MTHNYSLVFDTENPYWQRVLEIFKNNEHYEKKKVSGRNLHHKFPKSFSRILNEDEDNDKDNLISLSLADHFLVHYYYYLLAKKGFKQTMATAFTFMARTSVKFISPETAEEIAKDYAEAKKIADRCSSIEQKGKKLPKELVEKIAAGHRGLKRKAESINRQKETMKKLFTSKEFKEKMSNAHKHTHPHKSGRKGLPISEFGKIFYAHFGYLGRENLVQYRKELHFWRENNKVPSWNK